MFCAQKTYQTFRDKKLIILTKPEIVNTKCMNFQKLCLKFLKIWHKDSNNDYESYLWVIIVV